MDFKTGKVIEIIKEFLANGENKFEINGIDLSRAVFMYRQKNTSFEPIPKGNYVTKLESNILYLNIDDNIKSKAHEYQIIYTTDMKAGKYLEEYPEFKVLVSKYNDLVEDVTNIIKYAKSTGVKVDTLNMTQILTPLEPNTFWIMDKDEKIVTFPLGDLNSKYQEMISKLKKEVEELIKTTKEISLSEIQETSKSKISEFVKEVKKKIDELNTLFNKTQEDIKKSVDKLNNNEKEAIKEFERILGEKISSLNTLSDDLKNNLSDAVAKYIADNKEQLKGDKGEGITSIRTVNNNQIEVSYGDNKKEILTIPTVKGPKGEQGIQGERGPQGVKGDKGDTPEIKTNNNPLLGKSDTLATTRATYSIIVGDGLYTHQQIAGGYTGNGGKQPPSYVGLGRVRFLMSNEVIGSDGNYKDFMYMNTYEGSDVPSTTAFGINRVGSFDAFIMRSNSDRTLWQEKGRLWHSENFNPDNKLNKINKDNFEGFENGNVGLYIGTNNEVNFSTIYENLNFNYRQIPGSKKIKSITICNGESTGGRGDFYCGSLGATGNGTFVGNLTVQGEIVCNNNITAYSDIRLKSNIKKIDNALEKVCKINGYTFDINNKRGTGVIAQELQEILPEVVIETDTEEKYLSVAYGNIVGLLIEAIKDLKAEIEVLKNDKK